MRAVVQRVSRARVTVGEEITGEIGLGLLVLLGVGAEDTRSDADYLVEKVIGLRILEERNDQDLSFARGSHLRTHNRRVVVPQLIPGVEAVIAVIPIAPEARLGREEYVRHSTQNAA